MGSVGQLLLGGGVTGLIVAIVNFVLTRPKVRAEAANIANQTTSQVIKDLREDLDRVKQDNTDQRERIDVLEQSENASAQRLREMTAVLWDCATYIRKQHGFLTDEEKKSIGPPPDVEGFFR